MAGLLERGVVGCQEHPHEGRNGVVLACLCVELLLPFGERAEDNNILLWWQELGNGLIGAAWARGQ